MDFDDSILPESWRPDTCPHCGGLRTAIWYGLPTVAAWEKYQGAVQAGRLQLGGCCWHPPYDASRSCQACGRGINGHRMAVHAVESDGFESAWVPDSAEDRARCDEIRLEYERKCAADDATRAAAAEERLRARTAKRRRTWRYIRGASLLASALGMALAGVAWAGMRVWGARVVPGSELLLGAALVLAIVAMTRLANRRSWVAGAGLGLAGCAGYGVYAILQAMAASPSAANRPAYADPEAWAELVARSSPWEQVPNWALWVEGIWLATLALTAYQLWARWVGEQQEP